MINRKSRKLDFFHENYILALFVKNLKNIRVGEKKKHS